MKFIYLFALSAIVSSCSSITQEKRVASRLAYEPRTYKLASTEDCEEGGTCALFEISYPVFSGIDSVVAAAIQREIELSFSMGDPEADEKSIQQIATDFVQSYETFAKEMDSLATGWYYKGEARVNILNDTLISLSLDEESYTGGAHGSAAKYFINVNPATGDEIKLAHMFKPGFEAALTKVGEEMFRKERALHDTATYRFNGIEFPNGRFELNGNFGFTNEGIVFFYNNYEIAAFAVGPTEFVIPYSRIKDWLKNEPALK